MSKIQMSLQRLGIRPSQAFLALPVFLRSGAGVGAGVVGTRLFCSLSHLAEAFTLHNPPDETSFIMVPTEENNKEALLTTCHLFLGFRRAGLG